MNQGVTHHRILKPWRRYVSLFLSVVWLSVLVQPCVMAGSCNAEDMGVPGMRQMAPVDHDSGACAQCSIKSIACDDCDSASNHACAKADNSVGFDSAAAFEQKTKVKKLELLAFGVKQVANSSVYLDTFLFARPAESLPSGPSIIDLFQTYLI